MAERQGLLIVIFYLNPIAILRVALLPGYTARKDPGVKTPDRLITPGLQKECSCYFHQLTREKKYLIVLVPPLTSA